MAKTPDEQYKDMLASMQKTTGKRMPEWQVIVDATGLKKHGEIVKFLKETHGVTHGYANMITHDTQKSHAVALVEGNVDLETEWFAGGKVAMKPIYDKAMEIILALGNDIEQAPKKAYMSLRRTRQFACVGPFSKARMDLQIHLKGHPDTDRLKSVKDGMTSHVVKISHIDEIDAEVIAWLKAAYAG
jgi:predicted transport protein